MRWWRRLVGFWPPPEPTDAKEGTAPPIYHLQPYAEPITQQNYLAAWAEVRALPAGVRITAKLHERLANVVSEVCPVTMRTNEERSIWLANHDGRKQILEMLAREAQYNVRLLGAPSGEPKMKGPST